jgi:hypothetical protein
MARYYFPAEYDGVTCADDHGEEFLTIDEAKAHGRVVAAELGRNNVKSVKVFVVSEDGLQLDAFPSGRIGLQKIDSNRS